VYVLIEVRTAPNQFMVSKLNKVVNMWPVNGCGADERLIGRLLAALG